MNINQFYGKIMSDYTFDKDKIRENVLSGNVVRKAPPVKMILSLSALAACIVAVIGIFTYVNWGNGKDGIDLIGIPINNLTPQQREQRSDEIYNLVKDTDENQQLFITFDREYSPADAKDKIMSLSDDIQIKFLYIRKSDPFHERTVYHPSFKEEDKDLWSDILSLNNMGYDATGAGIVCKPQLYEVIKNADFVRQVDMLGKNDAIEELKPIENETPVITDPFTEETTPTPTLADTENTETSAPESSATTQTPQTTASETPNSSITFSDSDISHAEFLSNDIFVVRSSASAIYQIKDNGYQKIISLPNDYQILWIDQSKQVLLIKDTSHKLSWIDLKQGSTLNIEISTQEKITEVSYSALSEVIVVRTESSISFGQLNTLKTSVSLSNVTNLSDIAHIIGFGKDSLYYVSSENKQNILKYSLSAGKSSLYFKTESPVKSVRSLNDPDSSLLIFEKDNAQIFSGLTGKFTETEQNNGATKVSYDGRKLMFNDNYYKLTDNGFEQTIDVTENDFINPNNSTQFKITNFTNTSFTIQSVQ